MKIEKKIQKNKSLALLTTIQLGGSAKQFIQCDSEEDILSTLKYANDEGAPVHILGGGSNTVFADDGFDGLVIKIATRGVTIKERDGETYISAKAGELWDAVVELCVNSGLAGFECLSGIPGLVGAAPVQNIGAYGQEVGKLITEVVCINLKTLEQKTFSHSECQFEYRTSRFKGSNHNEYVITGVTFKADRCDYPKVTYPDLIERLGGESIVASLDCSSKSLKTIRGVVLDMRRERSMVADGVNTNSRSCGSFFINPIISKSKLDELLTQEGDEMPYYQSNNQLKIPAAWLIEKAGFPKGFRYEGVGISSQHNLSIVNFEGTTKEVITLARKIQDAVKNRFDIQLVVEPHLVPFST